MKSADRTFAGEDEAGQHRGIADAAGKHLVHTDCSLHIAATLRSYARQDTGGAFGMTTHHIFRVMQSMNEVDFVLQGFERFEGWSEFKIIPAAFGPPFRRMNTIAEKEESEAFGRLVGRFNSQESS